MKYINFLFILIFLFSCSSCKIMANYEIGLKSVENYDNPRVQTFYTINDYEYEDEYILITWDVNSTEFKFKLNNKCNYPIKINWDDISYIDINNEVKRIVHRNVKLIDRYNSTPSILIPKNANLIDVLLPADNVYYIDGKYGGYYKKALFPVFYDTHREMIESAPKYVGKTISILMPIVINNIQNNYIFTFKINKFINNVN